MTASYPNPYLLSLHDHIPISVISMQLLGLTVCCEIIEDSVSKRLMTVSFLFTGNGA